MGAVAGVRVDAILMRVCTTILGFAIIENVLRNASKADFWALKHWAIGFSSILLFQLLVRIPEFLTHSDDFSVILASPLVFLIALPFFVVSSTRVPQLQLRFHSSRAFVFHTATLVGAGILLQGTALAAWYARSYGGTNATVLVITVAFSGLVGSAAALSSGTVRSRIRLLINEYFFAFKYDYRVEWEKVIRGPHLRSRQASRGKGAENPVRFAGYFRWGDLVVPGKLAAVHSGRETWHDRPCNDLPGR